MRFFITILLIVIINFAGFGQNKLEVFYVVDYPLVDSLKFYYEEKSDTLTWLVTSSSKAATYDEYINAENKTSFDTVIQRTKYNDRYFIHRLRPIKFFLKNDTLFRITVKNTISADSMISIIREYPNDAKSIISKSKTYGQLPLFNSHMFDSLKNVKSLDKFHNCLYTISLERKWIFEGVCYFQILIEDNCGARHSRRFTISEDFEIIRFGGYYSKKVTYLTSEYLVYQD